MAKNPQIAQFLKTIAPFANGVGTCPGCGKPIGEFRDDLSQREFEISGLCQECQDSVFKPDPEEEDL